MRHIIIPVTASKNTHSSIVVATVTFSTVVLYIAEYLVAGGIGVESRSAALGDLLQPEGVTSGGVARTQRSSTLGSKCVDRENSGREDAH